LRVSNRTIWTLWHQGFAAAPPLVQACLESWRRHNPGWRIEALDQNSLGDFIDLAAVIDPARKDLTLQKMSNAARLSLLRRHGGVWTDATVFCLRPLDEWLDPAYGAGFFAFRNPAKDRMMSTWFLASEPDNPLLVALHKGFLDFINRRPFSNQNTRVGRYVIKKLSPVLNANVERSTIWLNPLLQWALRAYPYFFFHYIFNDLILKQPALRDLWNRVPTIEARPLHTIQHYARNPDAVAEILAKIDGADWPVQKLNWRVDLSTPYWSAVIDRLVHGSPTRQGAAH
jgi:hypothetical protein